MLTTGIRQSWVDRTEPTTCTHTCRTAVHHLLLPAGSAWHRRVFPKRGELAGTFNKSAYTVAAVERLRESLRRHEVFVPGLRKWGDPTAGLLTGAEWERARPRICDELNLSPQPGTDVERWAATLDFAYRHATPSDFAIGQDWPGRTYSVNGCDTNPGYGSDLRGWNLGPPSHDRFLKEFPQVSSNTLGFRSIATGTPTGGHDQSAARLKSTTALPESIEGAQVTTPCWPWLDLVNGESPVRLSLASTSEISRCQKSSPGWTSEIPHPRASERLPSPSEITNMIGSRPVLAVSRPDPVSRP